MSKINVTVDDFDPLISYSNYGDWQTPDPSVNPTWYDASRDVTGSIWHEGESMSHSWRKRPLVGCSLQCEADAKSIAGGLSAIFGTCLCAPQSSRN